MESKKYILEEETIQPFYFSKINVLSLERTYMKANLIFLFH